MTAKKIDTRIRGKEVHGFKLPPGASSNAIFYTHITTETGDYTLVFKSGLYSSWTCDIDDIQEIHDGHLPDEDALEACKKYVPE